jgi:hypothetical protein
LVLLSTIFRRQSQRQARGSVWISKDPVYKVYIPGYGKCVLYVFLVTQIQLNPKNVLHKSVTFSLQQPVQSANSANAHLSITPVKYGWWHCNLPTPSPTALSYSHFRPASTAAGDLKVIQWLSLPTIIWNTEDGGYTEATERCLVSCRDEKASPHFLVLDSPCSPAVQSALL